MKKLLSVLLVFALAFSFAACGGDSDNTAGSGYYPDYSKPDSNFGGGSYTPSSSYPSSSASSSNATSIKPVVFDEAVKEIIDKQVSFSSGDFSPLLSAAEKIKVTYPYEELYGIKEAYNKYLKRPKYKSTHKNYFSDGKFTADELFNIVKANNKKENYDSRKQISDADLKYVCSVMAPVLLDRGKALSSADAALLSEKIDDLRIYTFTGFAAGAYNPPTAELGLDVTQKGSDKFSRTVQHETHHMIQAASLKEIEKTGIYSRFGFASFEKEKGDPMAFHWIFEGTAELLAHNRINSRSYDVYGDPIKNISYIKVATLLRPNVDEDTFEELTLTNNFDAVFSYFGYTTTEQKNELLNMLTAINYYTDLQSCADEFEAAYKEKYGKRLDSYEFRSEMYGALGKSLSREFFKNLSAALKGKSLTVEEVFALNLVFEHRVCDRSLTRGPEYVSDMLKTYRDLQIKLFEVIAKKLGITCEEITNAYDAYYAEAELTVDDIPLVSKGEAEFLLYTTTSAVNQRTRSVNQTLLRLG